MKAQKKLNIVMTILIILLISIISFVGIFYQNENQMKDIVPSYKLGTNLKGYRKIILELKDSSSDSNTTNETTENSTEANTSENVNNVTNETNTVESNENTSDNYKKCASIIEKRLSYLKVEDFTVVCDSNTGIINILLPLLISNFQLWLQPVPKTVI